MDVESQQEEETEHIKSETTSGSLAGVAPDGQTATVEAMSMESAKGIQVEEKLSIISTITSIPEDTGFVMALKFFFILSIGLTLYCIATINVWVFLTLSAIFPASLMAIDLFLYELFIDVIKRPIARIKYATFVLQNIVLILVYLYGDDVALSHFSTWSYRLNVFEVLIDCIVERWWVMWIPSIMLLIPVYSIDLSGFPILGMYTNKCESKQHIFGLQIMNKQRFTLNVGMRKDDHFIAVWEDWSLWFIVMYTAWFVAWMANRTQTRMVIVCHTLMPLFAPPQLWFSVRTFTGMFMLWFPYLKVVQPLIVTTETPEENKGFKQIYNALFIVIFVSCYFMSGVIRLWEEDVFY